MCIITNSETHMTTNPEEQATLIAEKNKILKYVNELVGRRRYLEAIAQIERLIAICRNLGEDSLADQYQMKIQEYRQKQKSIDEDIQVLRTDEELRQQIMDEQEINIQEAQQFSRNGQYQEALKSLQNAIEFALKLEDKTNIWKLSKKISLLEEKLESLGLESPSISIPEQKASEYDYEIGPPETIAPPASSKTPTPQTIQPSPTIESAVPQIVPPPTIKPAAVPIAPPAPPITPSQPSVEVPVHKIEITPSIFRSQEVKDESTDSFLDDIVGDLEEKAEDKAVDSFLDSIVGDLDDHSTKKPAEIVQNAPISNVGVQPEVKAQVSTSPPSETQIPFFSGTIEKKETESSAKDSIAFFQAPLEEEPELEEEDESPDIFETADKKTLRKLKLAERIAQKKLEEAEKQFEKQVKRVEKQREKEDKKKEKEEFKKDKDEKPSKLDEKLKSKYQSPLPDDVLSEIRRKKSKEDS